MLFGKLAVQLDGSGRIRTSVDEIADEDNPSSMNVGQPSQLANDAFQLVRLSMDVADDCNRTINTLRNRCHATCEGKPSDSLPWFDRKSIRFE